MKSPRFKTIDIVFALALFCVFAISVLFVLLSGGRIYKDVVADMTSHYEQRTSLGYLVTKIHGCDQSGSVDVRQFGDGDALFLTEKAGEESYETVIYLHDGVLREYFGKKGASIAPGSGFPIVECSSVEFTLDDGMVTIDYETSEGVFNMTVALRAKEES